VETLAPRAAGHDHVARGRVHVLHAVRAADIHGDVVNRAVHLHLQVHVIRVRVAAAAAGRHDRDEEPVHAAERRAECVAERVRALLPRRRAVVDVHHRAIDG